MAAGSDSGLSLRVYAASSTGHRRNEPRVPWSSLKCVSLAQAIFSCCSSFGSGGSFVGKSSTGNTAGNSFVTATCLCRSASSAEIISVDAHPNRYGVSRALPLFGLPPRPLFSLADCDGFSVRPTSAVTRRVAGGASLIFDDRNSNNTQGVFCFRQRAIGNRVGC